MVRSQTEDGGGSKYGDIELHPLTLTLVDSWASASSHASCWSRDDDLLSFESLSVTSLQCVEPPHSLISDGLQTVQQYNHPTIIRDGKYYEVCN